jgi:hypothetical protein
MSYWGLSGPKLMHNALSFISLYIENQSRIYVFSCFVLKFRDRKHRNVDYSWKEDVFLDICLGNFSLGTVGGTILYIK